MHMVLEQGSQLTNGRHFPVVILTLPLHSVPCVCEYTPQHLTGLHPKWCTHMEEDQLQSCPKSGSFCIDKKTAHLD